jgi:outer membrane protein OmpA-like peptidoglycan-associated protein
MNATNTLPFLSLIFAFLLSAIGNQAKAIEPNYSDFLPKYRKFKAHFQIDKIEYRDKRTIISFRQIMQEDGTSTFYGGSHPNSWYLRTPPRMKGLEIQFKLLEIQNIIVNGANKMATLTHLPEVDYETKRGDVITYDLHFVRIPNYIRMVDLVQGENGDLDEEKANCFDIQVKGKDSPLLGTPENTDAMSKRFEQSFTYANPKVTNALADNKANQAEKEAQKAKYKNLLAEQTDTEPINYMPKAMTTMADIKCSERVIMPEVNFRDNQTAFSGRVKAIDNIQIVAQYLKNYPDASVRLHGHTDILGDEYKNLELSKERAMAVKRELVLMGIAYERIEVFFYGGNQPLVDLRNGGDANRRVEIEALCKEKIKSETPPTTKSDTKNITPDKTQVDIKSVKTN